MTAASIPGPETANLTTVGRRRHTADQAVPGHGIVIERIPGAAADHQIAVQLADTVDDDAAIVLDERPDLAAPGTVRGLDDDRAPGGDHAGHARPRNREFHGCVTHAGSEEPGDGVGVGSHGATVVQRDPSSGQADPLS